ncbi:hypothetical protein [Enterococcus sp. AZ072]|uniref:hypothetical protein n=1 Tax=unclassified Enterococcus TaxID=2608891 RepID=UPI003D2BF4CC
MMPNHRRPTKRNRNAGTKKSGFKRQNPFNIPAENRLSFYENLNLQATVQKKINGKRVTFLVEKLSSGYSYACTVDDLCRVLTYCPVEDLTGLSLFILRQPKKKETILSPCWGRFVYEFNYQGTVQPAIIIEAVNPAKEIVLKVSDVSLFFQRELDQLGKEGHEIRRIGKKVMVKSSLQSVRSTQLYRTVLHEVGHHVQTKRTVGSYLEKEVFADNHARQIRALIPDE